MSGYERNNAIVVALSEMRLVAVKMKQQVNWIVECAGKASAQIA